MSSVIRGSDNFDSSAGPFGLGYGQTWQVVTRTTGTTYTNNTGKPITLHAEAGSNAVSSQSLTVSINGGANITVATSGQGSSSSSSCAGSIIIPVGATYVCTHNSVTFTLQELR